MLVNRGGRDLKKRLLLPPPAWRDPDVLLDSESVPGLAAQAGPIRHGASTSPLVVGHGTIR